MAPEIEESPGSIEIESSSDTVEQVREALGGEVEETSTEKQAPPKDTTPAKEAKEAAAEAGEETEEEAETEEEEEAEQEIETEEEPPKKAPTVVSRKRLNEVIAQRNRYRQQAEEAQRKLSDRIDAKSGKDESEIPQTFSGKAEPRIDDFVNNDKYPDPYAAFTKAHGAWVREETLAEVEAQREAERAEATRLERTAKFRQRLPDTLELNPDYNEIVKDNPLEISAVMEDFVYDSEIGPDLLLYLCTNEAEAERIRSLRTVRAQTREMETLEATLLKEVGLAKAKDSTTAPSDKTTPPKKQVSKAPPPPNRLKPTGSGPKTLDELAGPADRTGIDIEFNPEYERAVKAQRRH